MTLTTAQQVRGRIQDYPRIFDVTLYGDGSGSAFATQDYRNLTSASAFVPGANGWTATGAAFNVTGFVTFSGVISANSAFRVRGVYSVFSDDEIGHFTAVGGSVPGAALEAVRWLRFDALKRAKWAAPDGTMYDDTMALAQIGALESALVAEVMDSISSDGGFESWPEGQEWYWW